MYAVAGVHFVWLFYLSQPSNAWQTLQQVTNLPKSTAAAAAVSIISICPLKVQKRPDKKPQTRPFLLQDPQVWTKAVGQKLFGQKFLSFQPLLILPQAWIGFRLDRIWLAQVHMAPCNWMKPSLAPSTWHYKFCYHVTPMTALALLVPPRVPWLSPNADEYCSDKVHEGTLSWFWSRKRKVGAGNFLESIITLLISIIIWMIEFQNYHPNLPIFLSNLALTSLALAGPPVSLLRLGGARRRFRGNRPGSLMAGGKNERSRSWSPRCNHKQHMFHIISYHKDV